MALNQNAVEYLLIGGYAMRFYGRRRPAKDVDVLTNNSIENAGKLFEAIQAVLGYTPTLRMDELTQPCKKLSLVNWGPDLDILTSVDGLDFGTAYGKRELAVQNGVTIPIVSKQDLLFIKRTAAARDERRRKKEQADIQFLESL
jgi:hypothetical protein